MSFSKMVNMARTPEEKAEQMHRDSFPTPVSEMQDYPYGLCVTLTEEDLEKLDLDDDCEIGDMIDLRAFARVTSVNKNQVGGKDRCRVELQIEELSVENEATEEPGEE